MIQPKTILLSFLFVCACSGKQMTQPPTQQTPQPPEIVQASTPDSFQESVKPMLARNCTPCHVPGGKMYARLPFDQPEVVLQNKDSILRRLKSAEDQAALKKWLEAQSAE